jgi:hypothetical protein
MTRMTFTRSATAEAIERDDGGQSLILECTSVGEPADAPDGMFVRVQSWSDAKAHPHFDALRGKFVVVTVETFENESAAAAALGQRANERLEEVVNRRVVE